FFAMLFAAPAAPKRAWIGGQGQLFVAESPPLAVRGPPSRPRAQLAQRGARLAHADAPLRGLLVMGRTPPPPRGRGLVGPALALMRRGGTRTSPTETGWVTVCGRTPKPAGLRRRCSCWERRAAAAGSRGCRRCLAESRRAPACRVRMAFRR